VGLLAISRQISRIETSSAEWQLSQSNFVLVLVPGDWFALKIGRRGRRFFSDTGDQREKKHEARYDKRGPHKDN
jgi:hypothetical protein